MRIIRFIDNQGLIQAGIERGDGSAEVLKGDLLAGFKPAGGIVPVTRLLAPVAPTNIFCIGLNYREHAKESGAPLPEHPVVFMKPTSAASNPGDPIRIPRSSDPAGEVDYECELAVVIGTPGRDIAERDALKHVLGYTAANDVSVRKWQRSNGTQWVRGKSFDTFCPLGPALVTPGTPGSGENEIADPQNLRISTTLNGKVMQNHSTGDMIFSVAQIIAFLSRDTTLLAGTVILTGTPQGVGFARQPPVWLKAGDSVTVEVERIGKLTNPVQ